MSIAQRFFVTVSNGRCDYGQNNTTFVSHAIKLKRNQTESHFSLANRALVGNRLLRSNHFSTVLPKARRVSAESVRLCTCWLMLDGTAIILFPFLNDGYNLKSGNLNAPLQSSPTMNGRYWTLVYLWGVRTLWYRALLRSFCSLTKASLFGSEIPETQTPSLTTGTSGYFQTRLLMLWNCNWFASLTGSVA